MSVSRVLLPVLDLEQNDKPLHKSVLKGARYVNTHRISADSASGSQCSFSFQPPSQNTVIDRRIELEHKFNFDSTVAFLSLNQVQVAAKGTNLRNILLPSVRQYIQTATSPPGGGAITAADNTMNGVLAVSCNPLAPKPFPIASCMDSIDLTINGTHFTASVNQYINAVMRYTTCDYRNALFTQTAHHPDVAPIEFLAGRESGMNLAGEKSRHGEEPRGVWTQRTVVGVSAAGTAQARLTYTFCEPLFLSPLMAEFGHGMTNINDLALTINWVGGDGSANGDNYSRAFNALVPATVKVPPNDSGNSVALKLPTNPILNASSSVFMDTQPILKVRYFTAQNDIRIPNEIVLPYKQPKVNVKQTEQVAAAVVTVTGGTNTEARTSVDFVGDNIRLNQVPEAVYLFAKLRRSDISAQSSDLFGQIHSVSIDWKNNAGILSGYDRRQLIELAQENGYDASHTEIEGVVGGGGAGLVLKLNYGKDIPLDDNESPGTRGDYNWQITCKVENPLQANQTYEFFQVFVYNGHAIISPNECRVMTGINDLADNVKAEDMGHKYSDAMVVGGSLVGGSSVGGSIVGGGLSHLFRKASRIAGRAMAMKDKAMKLKDEFSPCINQVKDKYAEYKTRA